MNEIHEDCVHSMLNELSERDEAIKGTAGEEAQLDQLCGLFLGLMEDQNHGVVSPEHIEGAILGGRLLFLRVVGLVSLGEVNPEMGHFMQHLVGEMGLALARAYKAQGTTVAELEELWKL